MKRTGVLLVFTALLNCAASASDEPPPQVWDGWHIRGPSGAPPLIIESLPQYQPEEEAVPLGIDEIRAMGEEPSPQPLAAGPINLDLQRALPAAPGDLIVETARGLKYDWQLCYMFVRDNIRFTPYKGIVKGPERTLIDREGNDADQAFLLLALLRVSGLSATVTFDKNFYVPLAGGENGYDAAGWFGVAPTGTVDDVSLALWNVIDPSGVEAGVVNGSSLSDSYLLIDHYWVTYYYWGWYPVYLDPSFKPCRKTPASASILDDMDYGRSNLLATAGGTVSNGWYVQGISAAGLSNELGRMAGRLAGAWRARQGAGDTAREFVGANEIVKQDLNVDQYVFHGNDLTPSNLLAKSNSEKNSHRAQMTVVQGGITNLFWLDELGTRNLWLSYTNADGFAFPKAVLRVDGTLVTNEPTGSAVQDVTAVVGIRHPSLGTGAWVMSAYGLKRAVTNVYAFPVGFGSDDPVGMRDWSAKALSREHGKALQQTDPVLRANVLNALGHQWLYQCALVNSLYSRIGGHVRHSFFETGVVGHEASSFFDFKTGYAYASSSGLSPFYGGRIFESALEHGVLDQSNGRDHPAVSTVRVIALANAADTPVYLVSSSNWETVRSSLVNYSSSLLDYFGGNVGAGQKFLLPQNGQVSLNDWSGAGFFSYGPNGTGSLLSGGLGGGEPSVVWLTLSGDYFGSHPDLLRLRGTVSDTLTLDPVDLRTGAAVIERRDLTVNAHVPLVWSRRYDSRQRWNTGALGRGWTHGFEHRVTIHAEPDALLGRGSPAACAVSAVACAVTDDLLSSGESAQNLTVACLVAQWWTDWLTSDAVTVTADGRALSFTRLSDGSYEPSPGVTASLSRNGDGSFELEERFGRTWTYGTNGMLSTVLDASGNGIAFSYEDGGRLTSVSNSFGSRLDFDWADGRMTAVNDGAGRTVRYAYSPDGCLTGVTDAASNMWKLSYDSEGAVLSETDPSGVPTVRNGYNTLCQVTNQFSAAGRAWRFAYAAGTRSWESDPFDRLADHGFTDDGRQAWEADRNGNVRYTFYDSRGNAVTNIDALGRVTVSEYDASNRLVRVTEAAYTSDARATSFGYDSRHRLIDVTNALGRVTHMGYDGCDRLVRVAYPDGTEVTNIYGAQGLLMQTRTLDASGRTVTETSSVYGSRGLPEEVASTDAGTTRYTYDGAGNVTNVIDAMGRPQAMSFDARGLLTGTADAFGNMTSLHYTPAGRLSAAVDALVRTNRFLWTPGGKPAAILYADGGMTTNEYDVADRLMAVKDPRGSRVAFKLDAVGHVTNRNASTWSDFMWRDAQGLVTASVDAVLGRTSTEYDNLNRPVVVADPLGKVWQSAFDALGGLTNAVDPRTRPTEYVRDALGRLAVTRYPSGREEGNAYDALGHVTAFTNAEGRVFRMSYDGQGRLTAATNAAGEQVLRNLFDLVGNLTNRIDGAGRGTDYKYDALNRRTEAHYADGAWERFGYDAVGNLTAASNAASRLSFSYDAMNRVASSETRVAGQVFAVGYGCDRGGLVTNVTYPGGLHVRYGYDADGRVTNVTDWANHEWTFTRDAAGRLTALSYPNGVSGSWTHDANHRMSGWSYNNGSPIIGRTITRDEAGVKIQEQVVSGLFPNPQSPRRVANTFDAADRLVSATLAVDTNNFAETYLYDGNGALTNRHSASSDQQFEYDCAGRMTFASTDGATLSVTYDALGNRLTTYSANATRIWITDHADPRKRPLMETDANGAPVRYFIWGGGLLLAVFEADGTVHYAHSDEQGSVVALTDSSGAVTDQYCYGPYGTDWGHSGTNSIPFRWLGSHGVYNVGGSPLYLTRYRAYDTGMGRFLSSDPLSLGGGPNLYAYCFGNPLAYIDPLGLGAEARFNSRLDTIKEAKALLQNQYGPVLGFIAGYLTDILSRSVTTAYNAEMTGISPETAFVLGQVQGISEASAASAAAGLLGLLGGETLGSATALLPIAGTVTGQVLPRGEGVLVAITPSGTVISSGNLMLSHSVFAQQAGLVTSSGGLVPGAFVGTAFNNAGVIAVLNSMSFYGNQAVASPSVQAIVGNAITAR